MTNIEELREALTGDIYSEITPISEIGGDKLIWAIVRMIDKILGEEPLATLLSKLEQTRDDCPCEGIKEKTVDRPDGKRINIDYSCPNCNGTGKVGEWHPERLVVLDADQSLPPNLYAIEQHHQVCTGTQNEMLRQRFRKIIVEG